MCSDCYNCERFTFPAATRLRLNIASRCILLYWLIYWFVSNQQIHCMTVHRSVCVKNAYCTEYNWKAKNNPRLVTHTFWCWVGYNNYQKTALLNQNWYETATVKSSRDDIVFAKSLMIAKAIFPKTKEAETISPNRTPTAIIFNLFIPGDNLRASSLPMAQLKITSELKHKSISNLKESLWLEFLSIFLPQTFSESTIVLSKRFHGDSFWPLQAWMGLKLTRNHLKQAGDF